MCIRDSHEGDRHDAEQHVDRLHERHAHLGRRRPVAVDDLADATLERQRARFQVAGRREVEQQSDADPRVSERDARAAAEDHDETGHGHQVDHPGRPIAPLGEASPLRRRVGAARDQLGRPAHRDEHDQRRHGRHDVH